MKLINFAVAALLAITFVDGRPARNSYDAGSANYQAQTSYGGSSSHTTTSTSYSYYAYNDYNYRQTGYGSYNYRSSSYSSQTNWSFYAQVSAFISACSSAGAYFMSLVKINQYRKEEKCRLSQYETDHPNEYKIVEGVENADHQDKTVFVNDIDHLEYQNYDNDLGVDWEALDGNVVHLHREVLTLQTVETSKTDTYKSTDAWGKETTTTTTTYTYRDEWTEGHINSSNFNDRNKRQNNPQPNITSKEFTAPEYKLGQIVVESGYLKELLGGWKDISVRGQGGNATCDFPHDNRGTWSIMDDNRICRKKGGWQSNTLGDMRVRYQATILNDSTVDLATAPGIFKGAHEGKKAQIRKPHIKAHISRGQKTRGEYIYAEGIKSKKCDEAFQLFKYGTFCISLFSVLWMITGF